MANVILVTNKSTGETIPYSSLKFFDFSLIPIKYDMLGKYLRESGKYETDSIKIERKELIGR